MESIKCKICGKVIEGYTIKHVETLLAQHMIKHRNEENERIKQNKFGKDNGNSIEKRRD